jgi:hypothetical protein
MENVPLMDLPLKSKPRLYPISIRLDADERREVKAAARRKKVTLTDVARVGALDFARKINAESQADQDAA